MSEIKNPVIKMVVKRTQYQEVTISEYNGYTMPRTLAELFELCEDVKSNASDHTVTADWSDGEYVVESFGVSINGEED